MKINIPISPTFVNKINKYWSAFIVISLFIVSCQEPMDSYYPDTFEPVINIEGRITTDTTQHIVLITKTIALNDTALVRVSDAQVTIKGNGTVVNLIEEIPGHYSTPSDYYGIIDSSYTLNVTLSDGEFYEATTHIMDIPEIDSVTMVWEHAGGNYYYHVVYYHGWELPEEGNAYLWNLYLNDTMYNDTLRKTPFVSDEYVNGSYIGYGPKRYFDTSDTKNFTFIDSVGSNFGIYYLDPEEITSDTNYVIVEMESITMDYYDFIFSYFSQYVYVGSPFDAPKANLINNLSNGALGYFYGASVKRYNLIYYPPEKSKGWENPEIEVF